MSKPVELREFGARVDVLLRVLDRYRELAGRRQHEIEAAIGDGLAGVGNREYFLRRLEEEVRRADRYSQPLSVLVLDLVGLPQPQPQTEDFDEALGEERFAGPAFVLVRAAGEEIRNRLRSHDLLARLRGARFAVMFPHTTKRGVQDIVARLRQAVAELSADPGADVSGSAGLSLKAGYAELGPRMDAESLLARAEPP